MENNDITSKPSIFKKKSRKNINSSKNNLKLDTFIYGKM
jgi:hypothetical protein